MKKWKSRVPKKRKIDGIEPALKMIIYPPAIATALLLGVGKKKRRKKKVSYEKTDL